MQAFHRGGHAFAPAEDCRARHEHGGAGSNDQRRCLRVDPPIHFYVAPGVEPLDQRAHPLDFRQGRRDELLVAETRVDGHDQQRIRRERSPGPKSSGASREVDGSPAEGIGRSPGPWTDSARSGRPSHRRGPGRLHPAPPRPPARPNGRSQRRESTAQSFTRRLSMSRSRVGRLEDALNRRVQQGVVLRI